MPAPDSISIIVPCYNDGEFLARSIPSVARQLGPDDEIVIVDDGSTDQTAAIAGELQADLQGNIVYCHQANAGVSSARNKGIGISNNPYLIFLDADDELLPGALDNFRKCFDADTGFYVAGHRWIREGVVKQRLPRLTASRIRNFDRVLTKRLHVGNLSSMCFRRGVFRNVHFDAELEVGEDLVVILLTLATNDAKTVPAIVTNVHRRSGSLRDRAEPAPDLESAVNKALFSHPCLPGEYQGFAKTARIRHYKTLLRVYWQARDAGRYADVFNALVALSRAAWFTKWTWRRLVMSVLSTRSSA